MYYGCFCTFILEIRGGDLLNVGIGHYASLESLGTGSINIFLHLLKVIVLLALSYFWYTCLPSTEEYLPHTVSDCKVIGPQAHTTTYAQYDGSNGHLLC